MPLVIFKSDSGLEEKNLDLQTSTIERHVGRTMTFCYYQEIDETTTYAGLKTQTDPIIYAFCKLEHEEPVDLTAEDWLQQWSKTPELIPDTV